MKIGSKEEMIAVMKQEGDSMEGTYKEFDYKIGRAREMRSFYVHLFVDKHMTGIKEWQQKIFPHGGIAWDEEIDGRHIIAFDFSRINDLTPLNVLLFGDDFEKNYWSMEEVQIECARVIDELIALKGS